MLSFFFHFYPDIIDFVLMTPFDFSPAELDFVEAVVLLLSVLSVLLSASVEGGGVGMYASKDRRLASSRCFFA